KTETGGIIPLDQPAQSIYPTVTCRSQFIRRQLSDDSARFRPTASSAEGRDWVILITASLNRNREETSETDSIRHCPISGPRFSDSSDKDFPPGRIVFGTRRPGCSSKTRPESNRSDRSSMGH